MSQSDGMPMIVGVKRFKLEKFDGDKHPGDGKRPIEIMTGGDGQPTRVLTPADPEFASLITEDQTWP